MAENIYTGMSHPFGILLFGETHTASLYKWKGKWNIHTKKENRWIIKIEKLIHLNPIFFMFIGLDILTLVGYWKQEAIINTIQTTITPAITYLSLHPTLALMTGIITLFLSFTLDVGLILFFIWIIGFSSVREYHGAEHKVILSQEENNLFLAPAYSRITRRCGSMLMPFLLITTLIWYFIWWNINKGAIVPFYFSFTIFTSIFMLKSKKFPFLEKIGIWFQRRTTKEPSDEILQWAVKAMAILDVEQNLYKEVGF